MSRWSLMMTSSNGSINALRHWPFVRGTHQSPVNCPRKGQWCRDLIFSLICTRKKRLSKQSRCRWFETPCRSLLRQCNVFCTIMFGLREVDDSYDKCNFIKKCKLLFKLKMYLPMRKSACAFPELQQWVSYQIFFIMWQIRCDLYSTFSQIWGPDS